MIAIINNALAQCRPFIWMVSMLFGIIAAWGGLSDLVPVLKQVWTPRLAAQSAGIIGACLALIAGRA